jgi:hypothetical protein
VFLLSEAGTIQMHVRVAVLSQPFPVGALPGARTPRELVERVRAAPAEAVALFDGGTVAARYQRNGWTYPVADPRAHGADAIRQFLAPLGLPDPFKRPGGATQPWCKAPS